MGEVGGYTMDLYCDYVVWSGEYGDLPDLPHDYTEMKNLPSQFYAQTRGGCMKQARKCGWKFKRDGTISCILCKN